MAQWTTRKAINEMPVTAMISFRPRLEENTNDNTPIFRSVSIILIWANLQKGKHNRQWLYMHALFRMSLGNAEIKPFADERI